MNFSTGGRTTTVLGGSLARTWGDVASTGKGPAPTGVCDPAFPANFNVPGSAGQPTLTRRQDGGPITGKSVRSINGGCGFAAQQHSGLASPLAGDRLPASNDLVSGPFAGRQS